MPSPVSNVMPGPPVKDPAELSDPSVHMDLYVLLCKKDVGISQLVFKWEGGRRAAIEAAKAYCNYHDYKFFRVEPFLTNINVNKEHTI